MLDRFLDSIQFQGQALLLRADRQKVLAGNIATGFDAINPATGAAVANSTEYDIDLNYRFSDKSWPKWAQPLWLRMRAGVLVPAGGGARTENYRIILNYPFELK